MTDEVLIDSNIIIDITARQSSHSLWSRKILRLLISQSSRLSVNQIVVSETINEFENADGQQDFFNSISIDQRSLPFSACLPAGRAHWLYRKSGGSRVRTLPDFLIGAHALVENLSLVTRDDRIYRSYFPDLNLISPEEFPL